MKYDLLNLALTTLRYKKAKHNTIRPPLSFALCRTISAADLKNKMPLVQRTTSVRPNREEQNPKIGPPIRFFPSSEAARADSRPQKPMAIAPTHNVVEAA